jgi:hypothetical protein
MPKVIEVYPGRVHAMPCSEANIMAIIKGIIFTSSLFFLSLWALYSFSQKGLTQG